MSSKRAKASGKTAKPKGKKKASGTKKGLIEAFRGGSKPPVHGRRETPKTPLFIAVVFVVGLLALILAKVFSGPGAAPQPAPGAPAANPPATNALPESGAPGAQ